MEATKKKQKQQKTASERDNGGGGRGRTDGGEQCKINCKLNQQKSSQDK